MRHITKALLIASAILTSCFIQDASAERRVAFVVGNGAYKFAQPLPNPSIDAKAMAGMLRNIGFEVVEGTDLGRNEMAARLGEFALKTQGADVALFFYAGHGIAVNGKNYLIPVDADLKSEIDVKIGAAIEVDAALDQTMSDAKVKLVLLDACRDNPFVGKIMRSARTRSTVVPNGLAEMKSGEGTMIAFATAPGQTALDGKAGDNSPFTRALIANLAEPGLEVGHALTKVRAQVQDETNKQQIPWTNTNLTGFVYMNPSAEAPAATGSVAAVATQAPAGNSAAQEVELEFWKSVRESNKPEELNAYLKRYPSGNFSALARARLASLQTEAATKPAAAAESVFTTPGSRETEDKLSFDRKDRQEIQKRLSTLGYFEGSANGYFRDDSRRAIEQWQTARNYPKSGYFNRLQHEALLNEQLPVVRSAAPAAPARSSRPAREAPPPRQHSGNGGHSISPVGAAIIGGAIGGMIGRGFR
jgi:peptidoglycan hydrolase-like protein with peptidoglycan-binding domain